MLTLMIVESDADSVLDEGNISSAQQILNQGAGITYAWHQKHRSRIITEVGNDYNTTLLLHCSRL